MCNAFGFSNNFLQSQLCLQTPRIILFQFRYHLDEVRTVTQRLQWLDAAKMSLSKECCPMKTVQISQSNRLSDMLALSWKECCRIMGIVDSKCKFSCCVTDDQSMRLEELVRPESPGKPAGVKTEQVQVDSARILLTKAGSKRRSPRPPAPVQRRRLVLNMDINKTVIMTDAVTGKTSDNVVNAELANAAWGKEVDGKWVLSVAKPSVFPPRDPAEPDEYQYNSRASRGSERSKGSKESSFISYSNWLATQYPKDKKKRAGLNNIFTHPGQPGESFAPFAAKMKSELVLPNGSDCFLIRPFFGSLSSP